MKFFRDTAGQYHNIDNMILSYLLAEFLKNLSTKFIGFGEIKEIWTEQLLILQISLRLTNIH